MRILRAGEEGFNRYVLEATERIAQDPIDLGEEVRSILRDVRKRGDKALVHYTQLFDGLKVSPFELEVGRNEIRQAYRKITQDLLKTFRKASSRIRRFHQFTKRNLNTKWAEKGIRMEQAVRPLERVGIYIPGGKASYPSTVLMAAIPAKVAGVREIVITTPPQQGGISPAVLVASDLAGADRVYRVGGVQAIAALAFGTKTIPRVDKIVGPGNRYVAMAKRFVFGAVDIDMVAGPSEVVVISDGKTPPDFVAADLVSQAEHDEMALCILITPSEVFAMKVREEVERQLTSLKRERIARTSLNQRGAILITRDLPQAMDLANRIAPEHLELCVKDPSPLKKAVKNAGAVFLGTHTPVAIGDYLAGPNHILPTSGTARFTSALGVEDFFKKINFIQFDKRRLGGFEKDLKRFTEWEGLEGHYQSVQIRMRKQ